MIEYNGKEWRIRQERSSEDELLARLLAFVPSWNPTDQSPGRALMAITARFADIIADRLVRAPDKAKLVFLDEIGVTPIPAQSARCPVVFEMMPGAGDGEAPAGTSLSAQGSTGDTQYFETESTIGLSVSRLIEVKAALPGDQFADYSTNVLGEKSFPLFDNAGPVPRELYFGHDQLFSLSPGAIVELQIDIGPNSGPPVSQLIWEYSDGSNWVGFAPFYPKSTTPESKLPDPDLYSRDGTLDLNQSGTIRLRAGDRSSAPFTVNGTKSSWIRARIKPLDPNASTVSNLDPNTSLVQTGKNAPSIDRVQVQMVQQVDGFQISNRLEKPVPANSAGQVRARLVDESGVPLDGYKIDRFPTPASAAPSIDLDGYTNLGPNSPPTDPIQISIQETDSTVRKWPPITLSLPRPDRSYDFELTRSGRLPDIAFGNGQALDPTATFLPFGPQPQVGATFLFTNAEIANKPGAHVTLFINVAGAPRGTSSTPPPAPVVRWEYWNGLVWAPLPNLKGTADQLAFRASGEIRFDIPSNLVIKKENGQEKPWFRVQFVSGDYVVPGGGSVSVPRIFLPNGQISFDKAFPPKVERFRISYIYQSSPEAPAYCWTYNDFVWDDASSKVSVTGNPFTPFQYPKDTRSTLYLGFSRDLPEALISLFVNVQAQSPDPELAWEYWDGSGWSSLALATDETQGLHTPGLVQFVWPGTSLTAPQPVASAIDAKVTFLDLHSAAQFQAGQAVAIFQDDNAELAYVDHVTDTIMTLTSPLTGKYTAPLIGPSPLARFGTPRHWVRVVWPDGTALRPGDPQTPVLSGIYLNAVWAQQTQTRTNEILGSSTGTGGQEFDFAKYPVLQNEMIQVQELSGALAEAGWRVLQQDLQKSGMPANALFKETDQKTGKVTKVWVQWQGKNNFAGSGPSDRHYVIDRTRGQLYFGDGKQGMIPPVLPNNIRATYQDGGGQDGNVDVRKVRDILGSVPGAQQVYNPIKAAGGANGEMTADSATNSAILARGPQLIRHRNRAVTAADYEQLALAASPSIAIAHAVTPYESDCLVPSGTMQLIIVPHADESVPEPLPSPALCDQVYSALVARAPVTVAGRISVVSPTYYPIGVEVVVVPTNVTNSGALARNAKLEIAKFLHPVIGGPSGTGWPFGQITIHRSDVVSWLHRKLGDLLDYVQELTLLDSGVATGDQVQIPSGKLPSAGSIQVILSSGEVCA